MLRSVMDLTGYAVLAKDGEIGRVVECFFDESTWIIRYVIVHTGSWLAGKEVLISPIAITGLDWQNQSLSVNLTCSQVESSPNVDTQKPLSREFEAKYFQHYRWPFYWTGAGVWGTAAVPDATVNFPWWDTDEEEEPPVSREITTIQNPLRSSKEVKGYRIQALDSEMGYVSDFMFNDQNWKIEFLAIKTGNWFFSKSVLIPPDEVDWLDWNNHKLHIHLDKNQIKNSRRFAA